MGIAFHSLLGGGQRQSFRPVSLLVQGGGDVRDGKLRPVTQTHPVRVGVRGRSLQQMDICMVRLLRLGQHYMR